MHTKKLLITAASDWFFVWGINAMRRSSFILLQTSGTPSQDQCSACGDVLARFTPVRPECRLDAQLLYYVRYSGPDLCSYWVLVEIIIEYLSRGSQRIEAPEVPDGQGNMWFYVPPPRNSNTW